MKKVTSDDPATTMAMEYAASGEPEALGEALSLCAEAAWQQARRLVGEDAAAHDVVQEAFLKLVRETRHFDGRVPYASWVAVRVHACACDYLRGESRRRKREAYVAQTAAAAGPVEDLDEGTHEEIRQTVVRLPSSLRMAIDLHYFAGLSQREAADALGVRENTVAVALIALAVGWWSVAGSLGHGAQEFQVAEVSPLSDSQDLMDSISAAPNAETPVDYRQHGESLVVTPAENGDVVVEEGSPKQGFGPKAHELGGATRQGQRDDPRAVIDGSESMNQIAGVVEDESMRLYAQALEAYETGDFAQAAKLSWSSYDLDRRNNLARKLYLLARRSDHALHSAN